MYVLPMAGFMELIKHEVMKEFSDRHFWDAAALVGGGCRVSPVRNPSFPFPSIISLIACAHSLQFLPFNFSMARWSGELLNALGEPMEEFISDSLS